MPSPKKSRVTLMLDSDVAKMCQDIARELGTNRSALIEGLIVRCGPKLIREHWKKQDRAKK